MTRTDGGARARPRLQLDQLVVRMDDLSARRVAVVETNVVLSEEGLCHFPSTLFRGSPHDEVTECDRPTNDSRKSVSGWQSLSILDKKIVMHLTNTMKPP